MPTPNPYGSRDRRPYPPMDDNNGAGPSRGQDSRFGYGYRTQNPPMSSDYAIEIQSLNELVHSLTLRNQSLEAELQQKDRALQDLNKAYQDMHAHREANLARCHVLEDQVLRLDRDLKKAQESKARHKQAEDAYEAQNRKLLKENEKLAKENEKLTKKLKRQSTSPPRDQQTENLAQRFERRLPRAPPYIEPFGPPTPRMTRRNSVSGTRYNVNVGQREEPRYSEIPRAYQEPGDYIPYPVNSRIV